MRPTVSRRSGGLSGNVAVPGDKSISHRAVMIGALAVGRTRVRGLLEGEDVLRTVAAMRALGAELQQSRHGWDIHGIGIGGLSEPADVLDMGNSGTAARLLTGLLATHPFTSFMTGDSSMRSRPMARVMTPLMQMGARFESRTGHRLPMAVIGAVHPVPMVYRLPVASAQVKSAILLAGLNTAGETTAIEPEPTRDHSELMLRHFGVPVSVAEIDNGARAITVTGQVELTGRDVDVPGDPSSAAFPAVAALLIPGSEITLRDVGMNPLRTGLFTTLEEMGADFTIANRRDQAGEPVADITLRASGLRGIDVPARRAPSMIDEYPILAIAAACARGTTRMRGLSELRVKESDRLSAIARGLAACGAKVSIEGDDLIVEGNGAPPQGGARVETRHDHRIAMSFLVLGCVTPEPVAIDDATFIETSFPGFEALMNGLGTSISADEVS